MYQSTSSLLTNPQLLDLKYQSLQSWIRVLISLRSLKHSTPKDQDNQSKQERYTRIVRTLKCLMRKSMNSQSQGKWEWTFRIFRVRETWETSSILLSRATLQAKGLKSFKSIKTFRWCWEQTQNQIRKSSKLSTKQMPHLHWKQVLGRILPKIATLEPAKSENKMSSKVQRSILVMTMRILSSKQEFWAIERSKGIMLSNSPMRNSILWSNSSFNHSMAVRQRRLGQMEGLKGFQSILSLTLECLKS